MAIVTTTHPTAGRRSPYVLTVVLATLGMLAIAGGITVAGGGSLVDGLGIGLFCALWGGPGFGLMIAGARWAARVGGGHL